MNIVVTPPARPDLADTLADPTAPAHCDLCGISDDHTDQHLDEVADGTVFDDGNGHVYMAADASASADLAA